MNHVIKAGLKYGLYTIYSYFSWMISYSKNQEKIPLEKRYKKVRKFASTLVDGLKVDLQIYGEENIPDCTACYFGNHISAFDPLPFFKIFEKPISFVGKKEVEQMPFVGKVFSSGGGLFLDRGNLKQEFKVMMKVQEILENKEANIFIFPEGTRNRDPLNILLPFHKGAFRSAMKAGVPIVPVVNYGTFRALSFKHEHKTYPTIIKFLKPIYPDEYANKTTDEIAMLVRERMQKELTYNIRKMDHENMSKLNLNNYSPYSMY